MLRMQTDSPLEQSLLPRPYNANAYDDASSSKDDFRFWIRKLSSILSKVKVDIDELFFSQQINSPTA